LKLTHDGLSIWYGTPDAPAPFEQEVVARDGASLVVGVHPANPTNSVAVHYRVDDGVVQSVPGREFRVDRDHDCQYFAVRFPTFTTGSTVTYWPVFRCGGRQVPPSHPRASAACRFRLAPRKPSSPSPRVSRPSSAGTTSLPLEPELSFVARISVHFERIDNVGETPEGVRVDFYADGGSVSGPGISGSVTPGAADHMYVRRDGIGVIRVRAALALVDGAKLEIEDTGSIDFGPDGYARALASRLPSRSTLVISPRILTGHPKYLWLNRTPCLGIGQTNLDLATVDYQLYSVRAHAPAVTP
jgi:hypothetical protein